MEDLYVIVGLGNPGTRYDNTRHNVGFEAVDLLAVKHGINISKLKHKALLGEGSIEGKRVILVKPQTFMNLSGESVREIIEWYKVPTARMIVIYDDIDLDLGKIRIRPKGSSGTHNGMRSVIYQIQSDEFPRIRIGISKPPIGWDLADFVLSKFGADDKKTANEGITAAVEAAAGILKSGIDAAMNKYNK
ncbi:MAG: aminoacyl-tRNA hydrolase [Clostridiales bacterium]|nr:aminoacyl-tRNA hydrolase [Clostridiales bacterium]